MADVTEEVEDTPQVLEPQRPRIRACTVRLHPVLVPVESTDVSASASTSSATVCNSAAPVEYSDSDSSTSWSVTTRQVLDNVLVHPSTKRQYKIYWDKSAIFCQEEGKAMFPIDFKVVGDFLASLASTSHNKDAPSIDKAAIRHYHGLQCPEEEDPTDNRRVKDVLKCVRKTYTKEVKKSTPISSEEVAKLVLGLDLDNFQGFEDCRHDCSSVQLDRAFLGHSDDSSGRGDICGRWPLES